MSPYRRSRTGRSGARPREGRAAGRPLHHHHRPLGQPAVRRAPRPASRRPRRPAPRTAGRRAPGRRPGRPGRPAPSPPRHPHLRAGQPDGGDVAPQHRGRPPVRLHEQRVRRAPGQRLQPQRTRAGAQVEHVRPDQPGIVLQRREQRLPHPVRGGPGAPRRHRQPAPPGHPGYDPHACTMPGPPSGARSRVTRGPGGGRRPPPAGRLRWPAGPPGPPSCAVIDASIFIASMVATVCPAVDGVALGRPAASPPRRTARRRASGRTGRPSPPP